jgi:hypothetical protein
MSCIVGASGKEIKDFDSKRKGTCFSKVVNFAVAVGE